MAAPRLHGPFQLTETGIDAHVQTGTPGVYALGYQRKTLFIVSYVARDDADVKSALRSHLAGPYRQFKLVYAVSARDAFLKECELYHDYTGLDNTRHPVPPRGTDLQCVRCQTADPEHRS